MRKLSFILAGGPIAALLSANPTLAQTAPGSPAAIVPASAAAPQSGSEGIADIVVTARRVAESVQRVPLAITVVTAAALQQNVVTNIQDLRGAAPSFYIATGAGGPSAANVAIRGQSQADTLLVTDPSVAVYVNDVNLPRQIGLRASFLDLDQVQVVKGPQGTLFGKNTTGGALLLTTKRPDLAKAGGFAESLMGNLGTFQLSGALSVPLIEDKLAVRVAGQTSYRNGIGHNALGQELSGRDDQSVRGSLLYEPTDKVTLFMTGDYSHSHLNGSDIQITEVNPFALTPTGAPANALGSVLAEIAAELHLPRTPAGYQAAYNAFVGQAFNHGNYDTNGAYPVSSSLSLGGGSADLKVDAGDLTFRSITGYRLLKRNDQQDYDQTKFLLVKPDNLNYDVSKSFTQEVQMLFNNGGPLTWIVGGFYSWEKGREGSISPQLVLINPNSPNITDYTTTNKSYSGFGQANYALTNTLKLTGGFRYTSVKQSDVIRNRNARGCLVPVSARPDPAACAADFGTQSSKPSYLASIDWQLMPTVLLYAKTSSSFRGGGINVRGQSTTSTAPFAPFKPEKATDYELGFKGDLLDRRLRINLDGYYTNYQDIQKSSLAVINNSLVTVISNAAKGYVYGGEAEITARPTRSLTLSASGSWTHARYKQFIEANGNDRTKEPFPIPEWQYTLSGNYTLPILDDRLSLNATWHWQSNVDFVGLAIYDDSVSQKAYGLLDGRLAYKVDGGRAGLPNFEVSVFAKNMLGKKYITNALNFDASLGYNIAFIGDPRTFGATLRIAFGGG